MAIEKLARASRQLLLSTVLMTLLVGVAPNAWGAPFEDFASPQETSAPAASPSVPAADDSVSATPDSSSPNSETQSPATPSEPASSSPAVEDTSTSETVTSSPTEKVDSTPTPSEVAMSASTDSPEESLLGGGLVQPMIAGVPDGGTAPYVYWEVRDTEGSLVPGGTFKFEAWTNNGIIFDNWAWRTGANADAITDCVGTCSNSASGNSLERDTDGGEWLLEHRGTNRNNNNRIVAGKNYRVSQVTAPPGYVWVVSGSNTQTIGATNSSNATWNNGNGTSTHDFGTFEVRAAKATITVSAGGDRTGANAVAGAPIGTVYQAVRAGGASVTGGPFECTVTTTSGTCSISVPVGAYWNVSVKSVPTGWYLNPNLGIGTEGNTRTSHVFQTGTLADGANYLVPSGGTTVTWSSQSGVSNQASGTFKQDGLSNRFSMTELAVSRSNPDLDQLCGLNIGFVFDQSGSMANNSTVEKPGGGYYTRQELLKMAAIGVIDGLTGTPSSLAIYTFASLGGTISQPLTSTATATTVQPLKNFINNMPTSPAGGTNWDRGLWQVLPQIADYDMVIFFTDGAPTFNSQPEVGAGNLAGFQQVEQAIFSANAIKASGVRLVAIGAGMTANPTGAKDNLAALTGPTENEDFFAFNADMTFVNRIKELAVGECAGTLQIQKQIRDHNGNLVAPNPIDANGWVFSNTISGTGTSIDGSVTTQVTQNNQNGFASAEMTTVAGQAATITVEETLKDGYQFAGASCLVNGQQVTTTVTGAKASFTVPGAQANELLVTSCVFTNTRPTPPDATVTISKKVQDIEGLNPAPAGGWTMGAELSGTPVQGLTISPTTTQQTATTGTVGVTPPWSATGR